jgi:hypothetical protein
MAPEYRIFIVVFIVGLIIYKIFKFLYRSHKRKKRTVHLKESGPQVPFHSLPHEDLISKFRQSIGIMRFCRDEWVTQCLFYGNGEVTNLMEGNIGSIDFVTFDYEKVIRGGRSGYNPTFRGTAILLQSDQLALPYFKYGRCMDSRFCREKIHPKTPPRAKEEAGFKQCPTCGSLDVRGGAMVEHGGYGDYCDVCKKSLYKMNEEKVRQLFEGLSLTDLRGWSALASNTQLLLYRIKPVAAKKYQEFMEGALKIFQLFQSSSRNLTEPA